MTPAVIPCPGCGTQIPSDKSEGDEKKLFQKSWYILTRLAWMLAGTLLIAILLFRSSLREIRESRRRTRVFETRDA